MRWILILVLFSMPLTADAAQIKTRAKPVTITVQQRGRTECKRACREVTISKEGIKIELTTTKGRFIQIPIKVTHNMTWTDLLNEVKTNVRDQYGFDYDKFIDGVQSLGKGND